MWHPSVVQTWHFKTGTQRTKILSTTSSNLWPRGKGLLNTYHIHSLQYQASPRKTSTITESCTDHPQKNLGLKKGSSFSHLQVKKKITFVFYISCYKHIIKFCSWIAKVFCLCFSIRWKQKLHEGGAFYHQSYSCQQWASPVCVQECPSTGY